MQTENGNVAKTSGQSRRSLPTNRQRDEQNTIHTSMSDKTLQADLEPEQETNEDNETKDEGNRGLTIDEATKLMEGTKPGVKLPGRALGGRRHHPYPVLPTFEEIYKLEERQKNKQRIRNLQVTDIEAKLTAISQAMGQHCKSLQNPTHSLKCTCLRDYLDTKKIDEKDIWRFAKRKEYAKVLSGIQQLYIRVWTIIMKAQLREGASDRKPPHSGVCLSKRDENQIITLISHLCNLHLGDCANTKGTNAQIGFSFGPHYGPANAHPSVRFCGTVFMQRILGLPESVRKGMMAALKLKSDYKRKLINCAIRQSFLNLKVAGYFEARVKKTDPIHRKFDETVKVLLEEVTACRLASKAELNEAVPEVVKFYVPREYGEIPPSIVALAGGQFNVMTALTEPSLIRILQCPYFMKGDRSHFGGVLSDQETLCHSISVHFVSMERHRPFFDALVLYKLDRPSITGNRANDDWWLRYVSTINAVDGAVQMVSRISRGRETAHNDPGPDIHATAQKIERLPEGELKDLYRLARAFENDVREVAQHICEQSGYVSTTFEEEFELRTDMGLLWTLPYYRHFEFSEEVRDSNNPTCRRAHETRTTSTHDRQFQVLHTDFTSEDLLNHQACVDSEGRPNGDLFWIAFLGMSKDGSTLAVRDAQKSIKMLEIPYGKMVVVPGSLLHAGGYCTSLSGNHRGHMYLFLRRKNRPKKMRRSLKNSTTASGVYAIQNEYLQDGRYERRDTDKWSIYYEDDPDHTGARKIFHDLFNI